MKKPAVIAWLTGLALAAVLTYPTIVHPATMARGDSDDGKFSIWNVAFVAHQLLTDPAHLYDANIFYPAKGALAYSEANLIAGALAVPVYAVTRNPIAAHNSVVYMALVFAFVAMWALVRRLTGSSLAGLIAGTAFAFSPFVGARTAEIQLLMVFVFPVAMLALHRFVDAPGPARAVVLGLALALAGLASGYYGIFTGLSVGLALVWFAFTQPSQPRYWLSALLAIVIAGAIVAPAFLPYAALRQQGARGSALDLAEADAYSATVGEYFRSSSYVHRTVKDYLGAKAQEVLFPGIVVCVFAGVGLAMRRRRVVGFYAVLAVLALWASFGPKLYLYTVLAKTLPVMSFLRAPARLGILVVFGLAVVAGFGIADLLAKRRRAWLGPALLALTVGELLTPWPLKPVEPLEPVYRVLAAQPRGGVLELQFPYKSTDLFHHARFMYSSMWHWQPLVNGYSDFIPQPFRDMAVPINAFPDPESFRIAQAHQTRYVVVHWGMYTNLEDRKEVRDRFPPYAANLKLLYSDDEESLYEIVKYPE